MSTWADNKKKLVIERFPRKNVVVIGDLMVDEYITGKVKRISPEAPVPILNYGERRLEAGGASNVAHNIKCLGAGVKMVGVVGADNAGAWLKKHFDEIGICTDGIFEEEDRPTTLKTRYATKGQQLLRLDNEVTKNISKKTQGKILEYIESIIDSCDVLIMSDYNKGVLGSETFVRNIIDIAKKNGCIVGIDSKSRNIAAFENADFVKPNNLELEEAVGIHIEDEESLNRAGIKYLTKSHAKSLVVTRGSKGISTFNDGTRKDFPAKDVQVYDVCGAGDTVISTLSLSLASGMNMDDAVKVANLAAGVVITKVGTVAITSEQLIRSINEEDCV